MLCDWLFCIRVLYLICFALLICLCWCLAWVLLILLCLRVCFGFCCTFVVWLLGYYLLVCLWLWSFLFVLGLVVVVVCVFGFEIWCFSCLDYFVVCFILDGWFGKGVWFLLICLNYVWFWFLLLCLISIYGLVIWILLCLILLLGFDLSLLVVWFWDCLQIVCLNVFMLEVLCIYCFAILFWVVCWFCLL